MLCRKVSRSPHCSRGRALILFRRFRKTVAAWSSAHGSNLRTLIASALRALADQLLHRKLLLPDEWGTFFQRFHTKIVAQSCEQSPWKCQIKGSENVEMSKLTELPSDTDGPDIDFDPDVDPVPAASPMRFGRLTLWVASASALTVGVA